MIPFQATEKTLNELRGVHKHFGSMHCHTHILGDIANTMLRDSVYLEIGCAWGATSALMLSNQHVKQVIALDLGTPFSTKIQTMNRIERHFPSRAKDFTFIEGNSHHSSALAEVVSVLGKKKVDILFIDGNHSFGGVQKDFYMYAPLVSKGGCVVFDDYYAWKFAPEVRKAVDNLVDQDSVKKHYEIIGPPLLGVDDKTFSKCNHAGGRGCLGCGEEGGHLNEFILIKK